MGTRWLAFIFDIQTVHICPVKASHFNFCLKINPNEYACLMLTRTHWATVNHIALCTVFSISSADADTEAKEGGVGAGVPTVMNWC